MNKARLDNDRTAKPKTRLIAHGQSGQCSPHLIPEALENMETGERIPLASNKTLDAVQQRQQYIFEMMESLSNGPTDRQVAYMYAAMRKALDG